jgi:rod shape determining protein RodA
MNASSRPISSLSAAPTRLSLRHLATVRWGLLVAALLLAAAGLVTVHSASTEMAMDYLPRQALWVGLGLLAFVVVFSLDYRAIMDFSGVLYGLGLAALVAVLLFGEVRGGARSWLGIGSLGGQPSEFMKPVTALLLARFLGGSGGRHLGVKEIAGATAIAAAPMLLVALEPDLGGAVTFLPVLAGALLVAGVRVRALVGLGTLALVLGLGLFFFGIKDYQRQRILTFFSPESDPLGAGYQAHQSKIAVGSGQLRGRGYLQGTQSQLRFLPERHTDFVFAVLAEEWGFLGVAGVLALYGLFLANGGRVAVRARDRSGILLVVGLLSAFAFNVLYNTAMVVGLVPITGIPLPFLSYGGSFTLVNFLSTGLILGVDLRRHVNR